MHLRQLLAPLGVTLSFALAADVAFGGGEALTEAEIDAIQAQRRAGAFDDALMTLDEHPAVAAKNAQALALRGLVLLDAGRPGAARVILARAFRGSRVRSDAIQYTFLGRMRFELDELKKATAAFRSARQFDAENVEAAFMVDATKAVGDADPALILRLRESSHRDALPKGLAQAVTSKAARAIGLKRSEAGLSDDGTWQLLEFVLEHQAFDADLNLACARVLHRRGETTAADELLDDVSKNQPHRMQDVLFERALSQHEGGESKLALETLDGAIRLGKEHTSILMLASELAVDADDLDNANRYLSLLEARYVSPEVDRLYARYCVARASKLTDPAKNGDRIVLLREAEKRCVAAVQREQFHVDTLERLLEVSAMLGKLSKVEDRAVLERWLKIAKSVRDKATAEGSSGN